MKLLVTKLWFPHDIGAIVDSLFRIPQVQELFDDGYEYVGEIRPRGLKICSGYWPADAILARLPESHDDVRLVVTALGLQGDYGRIHGKGSKGRAIASSQGCTDGYGLFHPEDVGFSAVAFGEIGHAIGLQHHDFDPSNPCEMSHNCIPGPHWQSLDEVRFCDDCYTQVR